MSIYGSIFSIEDERQWIESLQSSGIDAGVIRDGEPAPEDLDAPIIYQGSHILPSENDKRGGSIDLALIPSHITREGRGDGPEDEIPWPYLRVGMHNEQSDTRYSPPVVYRKPGSAGKPWYKSWKFWKTLRGAGQFFLRRGIDYPYIRAGNSTVVLTRPQVERLRDSLTEWIETTNA